MHPSNFYQWLVSLAFQPQIARWLLLVLPGVFLAPTGVQATVVNPQTAAAWWQQCQQAWNAKQYAVAEQSCEKALGLYREQGDRAAEATVLSGMGVIYSSQGNAPKAVAYQRQGLAVAQLSQNPSLVVKAWLNLGQAYALQPDIAQEIQAYEQYLIQRHTLVVSPSIQVLEFTRQAKGRQQRTGDRATKPIVTGTGGGQSDNADAAQSQWYAARTSQAAP
jgi:tetratricopeptide (TPR) repeat protein